MLQHRCLFFCLARHDAPSYAVLSRRGTLHPPRGRGAAPNPRGDAAGTIFTACLWVRVEALSVCTSCMGPPTCPRSPAALISPWKHDVIASTVVLEPSSLCSTVGDAGPAHVPAPRPYPPSMLPMHQRSPLPAVASLLHASCTALACSQAAWSIMSSCSPAQLAHLSSNWRAAGTRG